MPHSWWRTGTVYQIYPRLRGDEGVLLNSP